jgi:hypothetical protein
MTIEDDLETRLRSLAAEADSPPELLVDSGLAAFAMRDLDAELAELVADSALDEEVVLTRTVLSDVRMLSFECGEVTVELDVEADPGTHLMQARGLVVGATGSITFVRTNSRSLLALDADGRFEAADLPRGPLRLEVTTPEGRRVTTSWVSV